MHVRREKDKKKRRKENKRVSPFPGPNPTLTPSLTLSPNHLANKLLQTTIPTVQSNIFYYMNIQQGANGLLLFAMGQLVSAL